MALESVRFIGIKNVRRAHIPFLDGRRIPVTITLPTNDIPTIDGEVNNIARRIIRPSVQRALLEKLGRKSSDIFKINIHHDYDRLIFNGGEVGVPEEDAKNAHGNESAVVFSGALDRLFVFIGLLDVFIERGIKIRQLHGTSGGAVAILTFLRAGSTKELIRRLGRVLPKTSWQELADFNIEGLRDPSTFAGALKGDKLIRILGREFDLEGVMMSDFNGEGVPDPFVTGVALRNKEDPNDCGGAYVFHNYKKRGFADSLVDDPKAPRLQDYKEKFVPRFFKGDALALDALRASFAIPGALTPKTVGPYDFTDGAVRLYCPFLVPASFIDIGNIIAVSVGYTGRANKGKSNALTDLDLTRDIGNWEQSDSGLFHKSLKGVSVRLINPGNWTGKYMDVSTPSALGHAHEQIISGRDTMRSIFDIIPPAVFFKTWCREQFASLAPRFKGKSWGEYEENVYSIIDLISAIANRPPDDDLWQRGYKEDGGRIVTKQPDQTLMRFLGGQFVDQNGLLRALIAGGYLKLGELIKPLVIKGKK